MKVCFLLNLIGATARIVMISHHQIDRLVYGKGLHGDCSPRGQVLGGYPGKLLRAALPHVDVRVDGCLQAVVYVVSYGQVVHPVAAEESCIPCASGAQILKLVG